jgi:hypothetical protein
MNNIQMLQDAVKANWQDKTAQLVLADAITEKTGQYEIAVACAKTFADRVPRGVRSAEDGFGSHPGDLHKQPIHTYPTGYEFVMRVNNGNRHCTTIYGDGERALIRYNINLNVHFRLYQRHAGLNSASSYKNISGNTLDRFVKKYIHASKNTIALFISTHLSNEQREELWEIASNSFPHMQMDDEYDIHSDEWMFVPGLNSTAEQMADEIETLAQCFANFCKEHKWAFVRDSNHWHITSTVRSDLGKNAGSVFPDNPLYAELKALIEQANTPKAKLVIQEAFYLMPKSLPKRPSKPEEVYHEWDEEYGVWAVFGLDSGFCYSQPSSEKDAKKEADDRNHTFFKTKIK